MSKTVSVRIERKNSRNAVNGQRRHDERIGKQPTHIDFERTHLNSVLLKLPEYNLLHKACEELREKGGKVRAMRANSVVSWSGIITFGTEAQQAIEALTTKDQNERFERAVRLIGKQLNVIITSCVVHRDESAIHAHFTLLGVNKSGESLSKTTNRGVYKKLQDTVAVAFSDLGITRGEPKDEKIKRLKKEGVSQEKIDAATIHRSVQELHEDLPLEIDIMTGRLLLLDANFLANEALLKKAQEKLEMIQKDANAKAGALEKLQKRVETYERRTTEQQAEISELNRELERKRSLVDRVHELEQNEITTALNEGRSHGMSR